VEIGGILVGSREDTQVQVENFLLTACSHEGGPSFELSEADKKELRELLASITPSGLEEVGWFHSVSNRLELLSPSDQALLAEFFPDRGQFALVIRRAKEAAPAPTLFVRSGKQMVRTAYAIVPWRQAAPGEGGDPRAGQGSRIISEQEAAVRDLRAQEDLRGEPTPPMIVPSTDHSGADGGAPLPPPQATQAGEAGAPATETGSTDVAGREVSRPDMAAPGDPAPDVSNPPDPFTLTPNPALFYPSKQHREAIEGLLNGIRTRKGFLLLSGESGMGKTMVLECLMDRLKQEKIEYGFILNSRLAVADLFEMLRADFGLETASLTKTSVLIALNNLLLKFAGEGKTVALLVDDAHQLNNEVLEEIELMSNLETRQGKLLQVVFAARPEFELRLGEVALRGLRSRVMRRFRLAPLTEEETAEFIRVRLRQKQGGVTLVPESVFGEIHTRSGGIPRIITALCGAAIERCRGNPRGGR
jgi:general secretion pathway protein A